MENDPFVFLHSEYYATGEGITHCFLVTRAFPRAEDYAVESRFDEDGQWHPGELSKESTPETRALREFVEHFDSWMARGAQSITREQFLGAKYESFVPGYVRRLLLADDVPGNLHWTQQFHVNYS